MALSFVLTDLGGVERGELVDFIPGGQRRLALPVGSFATASGFELPLDHPQVDFLMDGDALLQVWLDYPWYNDGDKFLAAHLRLVTADEVAGAEGKTPSVGLTWADPFWWLFKRLIGKSAIGYSKGTAIAPVDIGNVIVRDLVDTTNAESPSGLRMGTVSASSSTYVDAYRFKKIAEAIAELCATLDGPDWWVRPIDWTAGAGGLGYFGELDLAPILANVQPTAAWEFADGKHNLTSYRRTSDNSGRINRAFHLPPGFPDNATQAIQVRENAPAIAAAGLMEEVVESQELTVDALRIKLLEHHIAVRSNPRQTVTLEAATDTENGEGAVHAYGVHYQRGDIVPFRAWNPLAPDDEPRVDGDVRIYQAELLQDDSGNVAPTLTVSPT